MELKEIEEKISLTQNVSKITRALELVSALKMKKAQRIALEGRPFARKVFEILKRLSEYQKNFQKESFYFQERKTKKIFVVVVSSDRGFCGPFNKNILNFAQNEIEKMGKDFVEIMAIGKKAIDFFKKKDFKVKVEFTGIGDYGKFEQIQPIAHLLLRYFKEGKYRKIFLFYTHFISTFFQKPRKIQILPPKEEFLKEIIKEDLGKVEPRQTIDYIFEPSPKEIFENLVPHLIEFEIYQAILEANASEHSARLMAMRRACENAKEMMENLILEYHKARQAQITSEVAEISLAKEAME